MSNSYLTPRPGIALRDEKTGLTLTTGARIRAGSGIARANRDRLMTVRGRESAPGPARETRDLGDIPQKSREDRNTLLDSGTETGPE